MTRLFSVVAIALLLGTITPPANAIRQLMVFFAEGDREVLDPEQWRLWAEADAVVAETASVFLARGTKDEGILLIASDQRVGTLELSMERSRRRLDTVKDGLVRYGVPRHLIFAKACGFERYLIDTPPGVSEPQNRYVAMDLVGLADVEASLARACAR